MDSAKYISHVGRLAVALGLGAAVATGHGVACADPGTSSSESSDSSPSASSSSTDGASSEPSDRTTSDASTAPSTPGASAAEDAPAAEETTPSDAAETSAGAPSTTSAEPGVVVSTGGALTSDRVTDTKDSDTSDRSDASDETTKVVAVKEDPKDHPAAHSVVDVAPVTTTSAPETRTTPEPAPETLAAPTALAVSATRQAHTTNPPSLDEARTASAVDTVATTPMAAQPTFGPIRFLTAVFAAFGLAPSPVPATPAEPPLLWGVLAFIRREIQRTLFNGTPTALPQQQESSDPGVITGTVGAEDPDGDALTYTLTVEPTHGTVTLNPDGTYSYEPSAALAATGGTDSFTVVVSDAAAGFHLHGLLSFLRPGGGHTRTVIVPVTVAKVNDAPTATVRVDDGTASDGTVTGAVLGSDLDGDPLTYARTSEPVHGTATVNADGTFSYVPTSDARHAAASELATDADTFDSFDVTVSDGNGGSVTKTVRVSVSATNTAPDISVTSTHNTDNTTTFVVTTSDADGDQVTVTTSTPERGTLVRNTDGTYTYTPDPAYTNGPPGSAGAEQIRFTAADGHHGSDQAIGTATITSSQVNQFPSIGVTSTPNSDGTTTLTVTASDPDGDTVTVTASTPAHGTLVENTDGSYTYTPDAEYAHGLSAGPVPAIGRDSVTFAAFDGRGAGVATSVNVTITPTNEAPVFELPDLTADPDTGTITGPSGFTDPDSDTLTYAITDIDPATGTLTIDEYGNFTFTPTDDARHNAADDDAPLSAKRLEFAITATDGHGGTTTQTFRIRIYPANNAPTIDITPTENPDGTTTYTITTNDADGDTVTVDASEPLHGTLAANTDGTYTYTPDPTYAHDLTSPDQDTITFTARDNHTGGTTTATANPTITPTNQAPTITITASMLTTGATIFGITTDDADGDTVTVTASSPTQGTLTDNGDGTWTYKPYPFASSETLTFTADDGHGGLTVAAPVVYATPNQAPSLVVTQTGSDATARTTTFTVSTSDPNGDAVTITFNPPTYGTLTNNGDGTFTYTQIATFHATNPPVEKLTFTATDGRGLSAVVQKSVPLAISNTQPGLTVSRTTSSSGVVTFDVTPSDADGDPVGVTATAANGYGTLTKVDADTWTYTPSTNDSGAARVDSITFTATDGFGGRYDVIEQVNIPSANTPPTITSVTGVRNTSTQAVLITVVTTDPNGDPVTVTGSGAANGALVKNGDGTFTYTQNASVPSTVTTETLVFTADDGKGGTSTKSLSIGLLHAPTITVDSVEGSSGVVTFTVTTSDADGGTVTVTPSQPAHGTLVKLVANLWVYTPDAAYTHSLALGGSTKVGTDTVIFTATDATGLTAKATETVSLTPTNAKPTVSATATRTGSTYTIAVDASDSDGDTVTTTVTQPSRGTVLRTGGNWVYIPTSPSYTGTDTIVFTSTDGYGGSRTTTVTVTLPVSGGTTPPVVTFV